jgi:hypothetical protein
MTCCVKPAATALIARLRALNLVGRFCTGDGDGYRGRQRYGPAGRRVEISSGEATMLKLCLIVGLVAAAGISGVAAAGKFGGGSRYGDYSYSGSSSSGFVGYIATGLHSVLGVKDTFNNIAAAIRNATDNDD